MRHFKTRLFLVFLILVSFRVEAYNFLYLRPDGEPIGWEPGTTIRYKVDPGPLGRLTNAQALRLVQEAMLIWENASSNANVPHFVFDGFLEEDVNGSNYQNYVSKISCYRDTIDLCNSTSQRELETVIIFDEDDSILDNELCQIQSCVAAAQAGVFSGSSANPQNVIQGIQVLGSYVGLESTKINTTMGLIVHELGHMLGLAHTSVNEQAYIEALNGYDRYMPTMFFTPLPIFLGHEDTTSLTLNPDDVAGISTLYPSTDASRNTGKIKGQILKSDQAPMVNINIIARNIEDPLCNAYSFLSGRTCMFSANCTDPNRPADPKYGILSLPSGSYTVEAEEIANTQLARTYAPGLVNPFISGDAEFWNENDQASEVNTLSSRITLAAGETRENIDIILNRNTVTDDRIKYIPLTTFTPGAGTSCPEAPTTNYAALIGISENTGGISGSSGSSGVAGSGGSASENNSSGGCSLLEGEN